MTKLRVLLVDDEKAYVESLAKVLRRRGVEAQVAFDGATAVKLAAGEPPDVIVLDLRMPLMDGIATLDALRALDPQRPVILLTGHADLSHASAALARGAADVLLKPCPVETLLPVIENAAERFRLR